MNRYEGFSYNKMELVLNWCCFSRPRNGICTKWCVCVTHVSVCWCCAIIFDFKQKIICYECLSMDVENFTLYVMINNLNYCSNLNVYLPIQLVECELEEHIPTIWMVRAFLVYVFIESIYVYLFRWANRHYCTLERCA